MSPHRYIIIFRNPSNGKIDAVRDDDGNFFTWPTEMLAEEAADSVPICRAYPYSVVRAP